MATGEGKNHTEAVRRLRAIGKTFGWLAYHEDCPRHWTSVYRWLKGKHRMQDDAAAACMRIIAAEEKRQRDRDRARRRRRRSAAARS
jgi:hypothetical protein